MTLFHHNESGSSATPNKSATQNKRRMSLFSFGSSAKNSSSRPSTLPNSSTVEVDDSRLPSTSPRSGSASAGFPNKEDQASSFTGSPVAESCPLSERAGSDIFERSVQDLSGLVKQEDYIPPALDATAEILGDKDTDLDEVEMIFSNRRNSSVLGLNMALGRSYTPLRKNSVYSVNQHGNSSKLNSMSSLSNQPQSPVSPPKLVSSKSSVSFYSYADMINSDEFSRRPSIMHSYSHGVVPTLGRKMSVASNHSTSSVGNQNSPNNGALNLNTGSISASNSPISTQSNSLPFNKLSRKLTLNSVGSAQSQSQLSKQIHRERVNQANQQRLASKANEKEYRSLNKFLISPESSDSEEQDVYYPAEARSESCRKKSLSSNSSAKDSESLVSFSAGDRIRQCTTEISGH